MDVNEHLLTCLAEECAEISEQCSKIAVRASKALRFGTNEVQPGQLLSNVERLSLELADILAVAEMLESAGIINRTQVVRKKIKIDKFMAYARQCGALE